MGMLVGNKCRAVLSRRGGIASGVLDGAPLFRAGYLRPDARRCAPTLHVPLAMQNAIVSLAIIAS